MTLTLCGDELIRMRNAVAMGWDWTHCYGIDFEAAFIELLDYALDGGESVGERILAEFPDSCGLRKEIDCLVDLAYSDAGLTVENIEAVIKRLEAIEEEIDEAEKDAQSILEATS